MQKLNLRENQEKMIFANVFQLTRLISGIHVFSTLGGVY